MSAIAVVLAGCGGGGGGTSSDNGSGPTNNTPAASVNPLPNNLAVDAESPIVPIDLSAAYFVDRDGDDLTFSVTGLNNTGLTYDPTNERISGTIAGTEPVMVTITVADGNGGTVSDMFTITPETSAEGVARPTFNDDQINFREQFRGGVASSINVGDWFNDPDDGDDNDLNYSAVFSRTNSGLGINSETGEITGTLAAGAEDVVAIITVRHGEGGDAPSVEHRVRISVVDPEANRAPMTTPDAPTESVVLTTESTNTDRLPIDVGAWFTDTDGTIATIEVVSGLTGTGLEFDAAEREIRGSFIGTSNTTVRLRATDDDGASVEHVLSIMANAAPTVASSALREVNLTFGTDMNLPIDLDDWFNDAAGDTLTHTATVDGTPLAEAGIGLEVSGDEITGTFAGTTNVMIEVTARDNHGATSAPHTFTIGATVPDLVGTAGNDDDLTDNAPNWNRTIRGLGGDDTISGGGGADIIHGGTGNDTLYGNTATSNGDNDTGDTAVYEGSRSGYDITAETHTLGTGSDAEVVARLIVRDIMTGGSETDEGTDTLTGFEAVRFENGAEDAVTLNVVYATIHNISTLGDDNANIIVASPPVIRQINDIAGFGGADLILGIGGRNTLEGDAGDDTIIGGVGVDHIQGGDDDDTLAGGAGDDVIGGDAGDDTIDGGADNDIAVYTGSVGDYAIWQTGTEGNGNPRTFVVHKNDTDTALGRDILTNVETLSFVDLASFTTTRLALDAAVAHDTNDTGITTTDMAPTTALNATAGTAIMNQDVSDWFEGGVGTVTYSATGTGNGVSFSSANNMITGTPTAEGTITIMVTASHVDDMMYDDVTVTYVINVAAAGALRAARKDEIVAFSLDEDPRHEADESYAGLAGPLDNDAFRVESDMDDVAASLSDMDDPCGCFL